ncbi:MAG: FKBP-type peptidyl-prolyl cis-trans isomerase [Sandaracinaceae bacterium]|nr:FKBP-type peptidyl-prolyl cis-trans isomerase [Sandaracinaceae bacterium]
MSDAAEVVGDGKVVSIEYVLTDPSGEELDRSGETPMAYLHGSHNIVPGLEEALHGKTVGDSLRVEVPPGKGYGEKGKTKPQRVLRSHFPPDAPVEKGAQFLMRGQDGQPFPIWITKVMGREVYVSAEHPLAGVTLCFDVTVRAVRDATDEERSHGHVHGPGGHHHHGDDDDDDGEEE